MMSFETGRAEGEWSQFKQYLSPAFFDVVNPLAAAGQIAKLGKSLVNQEFAKAHRTKLAAGLEMHGTGLIIGPAVIPEESAVNSADSTELSALLCVFFYQLLHMPAALLDFRRSTISSASGRTYWDPSSLHVIWDSDFIAAVRDMYAGFYSDDHRHFAQATRALGLEAATDILIGHFGSNQNNHHFRLKDFRKTFHEVFLAAKKARSRIHPQFLPFGLSLATLYQTLESSGQAFDVRGAYFNARG